MYNDVLMISLQESVLSELAAPTECHELVFSLHESLCVRHNQIFIIPSNVRFILLFPVKAA